MICVMARAPVAGTTKTRLAPVLGDDGAAGLARAMADDVLATVRATGMPYRVCVAGPMDHPWVRALRDAAPGCVGVESQPHGDLGARLAHALRDGGVAIGTDAPLLDSARLTAAVGALAEVDVVLAPADDGGYVLVGCRAAHAGALFEGVPWSASTTYAAQVARCRALGLALRVLPGGADVDTPDDLRRLRVVLRSRPVALAPRTRAFLEALDAAALR